MDNYTDMELVDMAQRGHENAFENLVQRYYSIVYGLSFKYCRVKEDAEDITQEVFIKVARKISSFNRDSLFKTWLFRIAINTATDFLRKRTRSRETSLENSEAIGNPSPSPEDSMEARLLYDAIDRLPEKQKSALILVLSEGLSHKEAAKVLKCSETTVSWRIHRARKHLKKLIPGRYEDGR